MQRTAASNFNNISRSPFNNVHLNLSVIQLIDQSYVYYQDQTKKEAESPQQMYTSVSDAWLWLSFPSNAEKILFCNTKSLNDVIPTYSQIDIILQRKIEENMNVKFRSAQCQYIQPLFIGSFKFTYLYREASAHIH